MLKNRFTLVLFALLAVFMASCGKDWLEVKPTDGVIKERYWNTKEEVYNAVIGCYQGILGTDANPGGSLSPIELMFAWGELRADNVVAGTLEDASLQMIFNGNLVATNKFCNWTTFYKCINYCNLVIKLAPEVRDVDMSFTEAEMKAFQGEARGIRGMMYLNLVKTFGNIPMRFTPSETDDEDFVNVVQLSEMQALDSIVEDLLVALDEVPATYGTLEFDKGRITKNTIRAILADAYLWMGRYDDVVQMCNQIITSRKFLLFDAMPVAIMTGVDPDPGPGNYDLSTQRFKVGGSAQNDFIDYLYYTPFSTEVVFELLNPSSRYNPFNRNDTKYPLMLAENGSNVKIVASPKVSESGDVFGKEEEEDTYATELADGTLVDVRGENTSYKLQGPGMLIWKLRARSKTQNKGDRGGSWYLYRYADVLLMKAEAIAVNPNSTNEELQEALDIVLDLRMKRNALCQTYREVSVGGIINAADLADFVLEERNRELIFEGKRWFDLVRYVRRSPENMARVAEMLASQASTEYAAQLATRLMNEQAYFWPIYQSEIENSNGSLVQNPFYL